MVAHGKLFLQLTRHTIHENDALSGYATDQQES
jgi:hypothetical protein